MIPVNLLTQIDVLYPFGVATATSQRFTSDARVLQDYMLEHEIVLVETPDLVLQGNAHKWAVYYVLARLMLTLRRILSPADVARVQEIQNWIHDRPVNSTLFGATSTIHSPRMLWWACETGSIDAIEQAAEQITSSRTINYPRMCHVLHCLGKHLPVPPE